jgi:hypothetical protein
MNENNILLHNLGDNRRSSKCTICCHMCSCSNTQGVWYTKFGKCLTRGPFVLILIVISIIILDLMGIGATKIIFSNYNLNNGCPEKNINCTVTSICYYNNWKPLIIGCASIGSIAIVILIISILFITIFVGTIFYCFDSCCGEIDKSYKQTRFGLNRNRTSGYDTYENI